MRLLLMSSYCLYIYLYIPAQTLEDLPGILRNDHPDQYTTAAQAETATTHLRQQINDITAELFRAYENEYTVFAPLSNCFEWYGLDFLVDQDMNAIFLEVNPGPDFKQTGDRLKTVIQDLFEQTCELILDRNILSTAHAPCVSTQSSQSSDLDSAVDVELIQKKEFGTKDFQLVYDKEWSVSRMTGGFSFNK